MARRKVGSADYVRPRWSGWLTRALQSAAITAEQLGADIGANREAESGGGYGRLVRDWLDCGVTVSPESAFEVGEILRERLPWSSGFVALYAAGYIGDYALTLDVLSLAERGRVLMIAAAVPYLAVELREPVDALSATVYADCRAVAYRFGEIAAEDSAGVFLTAFAKRSKSRPRGLVNAVRVLTEDRSISPTDAEQSALHLLERWTDSLVFQNASSPSLKACRALIRIYGLVRARLDEEDAQVRTLIDDARAAATTSQLT